MWAGVSFALKGILTIFVVSTETTLQLGPDILHSVTTVVEMAGQSKGRQFNVVHF